MRNPFRFHLLVLTLALILSQGVADARDGVIEVASGVYVWPGAQEEFSPGNSGHIANIGFIAGEQKVAVIDTGSTLAEGRSLRRMIRETTSLPIAYVILTHMHPDHVLGAAAFNPDTPVYIGHEQLGDAMARRQQTYLERMHEILGEEAEGTRMVFPGQSVRLGEVVKLDLGERTLQLRAQPTAHTNNDLTVFDEKTGTFWLSDLLFIERIPVMDGSLLGWLRLIEQLTRLECFSTASEEAVRDMETEGVAESGQCREVERVVPGHGPVVADWKAALASQRHYLENLAEGIRKVIQKGGTISEAVETVGWEQRDSWLLFDQYHGRNVTAGFAELEWE